jgi:hypothetical protein
MKYFAAWILDGRNLHWEQYAGETRWPQKREIKRWKQAYKEHHNFGSSSYSNQVTQSGTHMSICEYTERRSFCPQNTDWVTAAGRQIIYIYLTGIGFQPGVSSNTIGHNRQVTRMTRIQNTFKQNTILKDITTGNTEAIQTTTTI